MFPQIDYNEKHGVKELMTEHSLSGSEQNPVEQRSGSLGLLGLLWAVSVLP